MKPKGARNIPPAFVTGVVLADIRLTDFAKLIFGVINLMASQKDEGEDLRLSNERLAEWFGNRSERSVSRAISELVDAGYLTRIVYPNGVRLLEIAPTAIEKVKLGNSPSPLFEEGPEDPADGVKNADSPTPPLDKNVLHATPNLSTPPTPNLSRGLPW